jgi:DNA-binding beta-propeller fold protein YncE
MIEMKKNLDLMKWLICCSVFVAGFTACEKDDPIPTSEPVIPGAHGVFILNEGGMGANNAGLSYRNFETGNTSGDLLGGKLGDTGQDMIAYGNKLYISVNGSAYIRVVDMYSFAALDSIVLKDGEKPLLPRYLASYEGKVYVTAYDEGKGSVIRIDTATLKVEKLAHVGSFPEGIAALKGKLYVANGGQGAGNTLSVVDIAKFEEETTISVGVNPYIVRADQYGDLYLSHQGDFGDDNGGLQRINPETKAVTSIDVPANRNFVIVDDLLYFFGVTYNADYSVNSSFGTYNVKTETLLPESLISDGTPINVPYGIGVNPKTKEVYISDTDYVNPGTVSVFGTDGKLKESFKVGVSANTFVFN